jgi:hypothetical protein
MENNTCSGCVLDSTDPNITFNTEGVCDYCLNYKNNILPEWNFGTGRESELELKVNEIKKEGTGKEFDCILGLSGGLDSAYLAHIEVVPGNGASGLLMN